MFLLQHYQKRENKLQKSDKEIETEKSAIILTSLKIKATNSEVIEK
jgi:hypothetical protein